MIKGYMLFPQHLLFPQRTIYRSGALAEFAESVKVFGVRGLVVHGRSCERTGKLEELRGEPGEMNVQFYCRQGFEPDTNELLEVIRIARAHDSQWIAGIGGGSVLDLAKAAAGLYYAKESLAYYQAGGQLRQRGIPFIAIPSIAGSGSEATFNSVIINRQTRSKLSIRDISFLARTVILDPTLLSNVPKETMSYAAMDGLAQAYESYTSRNANWFSSVLSLKAMELIDKNITPAYKNGDEKNFSELLLASYLGGIALSQARLGVIHGIAHPLGALYNVPHGLICSVCLSPSIQLNRQAMGEKYQEISALLGMDFIQRIEQLLEFLAIRSPFKGLKLIEKEKIIREALESGSTASNPKAVTDIDIQRILEALF